MNFYEPTDLSALPNEVDRYIIVHSEKVPEEKQFAILLNTIFLEKLLGKQSWNILKCLISEPKYSTELANELLISEQLISYHIRKLLELGLITYDTETIDIDSLKKPRAVVRKYSLKADLFLLDLKRISTASNHIQGLKKEVKPGNIPSFLQFIYGYEDLNGYLVVGSSISHGKYSASSHDGHFAAMVGFLLGKLGFNHKKSFFVKLDIEINKENKRATNLIILGGPRVNVLTSDLQEQGYLLVDYIMEKTNTIRIKKVNKELTYELLGIIQKIPNPWNDQAEVLIIAGSTIEGTRSAVMAVTQFAFEVETAFKDNGNYCLVVGLLDDHGDVFSVRFLKNNVL